MTQHEKIIILMQERGNRGINSFDARRELNIIQLPARVKELKAQGYLIVTRKNANKSVDYILLEEPKKDVPVEKKIAGPIQQPAVNQQHLF